MKVDIKNFNCIDHIDIEFPESSIIAITGDSNNGKSSIFKAIRTFALNSPGNSYIKQGQETCDIELHAKGHVVKRHRTATSTSYEVDGNLIQKLGFNTVDLPIKLDTSADHLNFWDQMTMPFLLGRTPTEIYKYLVQSRYVSTLAYATDQAKEDIKTIKNQILSDEAQIDLLEGQISDIKLEDYKPITESKKIADHLKLLNDTAKQLSLLVNNLPDVPVKPIKPEISTNKLDDYRNEENHIIALVRQLQDIGTPNEPKQVTFLINKYNNLDNIYKSYITLSQTSGELGIATVAVEDAQEVIGSLERAIESANNKLQHLLSSIDICPVCGQPIDHTHQ